MKKLIVIMFVCVALFLVGCQNSSYKDIIDDQNDRLTELEDLLENYANRIDELENKLKDKISYSYENPYIIDDASSLYNEIKGTKYFVHPLEGIAIQVSFEVSEANYNLGWAMSYIVCSTSMRVYFRNVKDRERIKTIAVGDQVIAIGFLSKMPITDKDDYCLDYCKLISVSAA